jgi:hypothetical protein
MKAATLPHSWPVSDWPPDVYPNKSGPGNYLVKRHREELTACGALSRIGRDLAPFGVSLSFTRFPAHRERRFQTNVNTIPASS